MPVFVYHIERQSQWAAAAASVLRALADRQFAGVTSTITLLELTIKPLRLGRTEIADAYMEAINNIPNLTVVNLDRPVIRTAAELRAAHGLRTPDALQIAACIVHGAGAFVTNDRRLRRVKVIDVLVLDDFV